ncbi:MAG TPA: FtsQ-type POTRA domain-containing protein [Bryobacteraceae bacterium]|jgi:cell division protein FtsQ|nr:FtsQ-type POTRA domain-containing protein [Bryobacteraceae bacterium]
MARESKKATVNFRWRLWLGLVVAGAACVSSAMAGLKVRQFVLSDPQFTLSREHKDTLTIQGMNFTSRSKVLRVFSSDFGHSVFSVPLAERRRRLLAIDWVEDASVSRIWPDRLVVRIHERTPVAFVFFRSGVLLIDSRGVLLDPPAQAQFAFPVLSGVREEETEDQRRERVRCLARVQEDLGYMAKDISEVNASDPDNIRIVAQIEHRTVELIMGDSNFGRRYQNFLSHYPEIEKHSPNAKRFDLRLDDRITAED